MRAYMSRTGEADHGRQCLDCNYFPSGHAGGISDRSTHAEREARAILAKTERPNPQWSAHLTARGILPYRERIALAESLSAFIEQEF